MLGPLPFTDYTLDFSYNLTATTGIEGVAVMSYNHTSDDIELYATPTSRLYVPIDPIFNARPAK